MNFPLRRSSIAAVGASLALTGCGGDERPRLSPEAVAGQQVFLEARCGSCHTLGPFSGVGGPNLDRREPRFATVVDAVTLGRKRMSPYAGTLSERAIRQVAAYVVEISRG